MGALVRASAFCAKSRFWAGMLTDFAEFIHYPKQKGESEVGVPRCIDERLSTEFRQAFVVFVFSH